MSLQEESIINRSFKRVKHPHIKQVSREDLVKFQLRYTLEQYRINESELTVLAYVYLYGKQAVTKLINIEFSKSEKSIENIISKYRKKGIITKQTTLHKQIKPFVEDLEFSIKFKLDD